MRAENESDAKVAAVSVEDATVSGFAQISDSNRNYRIELESELESQLSTIWLYGTTQSASALSVSRRTGILSLTGVTEGSVLTINGAETPYAQYQLPLFDAAGENTLSFTDVSEEDYFYAPVQWAVGQSITNGTTRTTFSPNNPCTRSHVITFLCRANGCPEPIEKQNPFFDVPQNAYYEKASRWAYERGLETGTQFAGSTPCTRAGAVIYFWKLAGRPKIEESGFRDVSSDSPYAQAVAMAVQRGITNGTTKDTFSPERVCTRGNIVTFLWRYYAKKDHMPVIAA